MAISYLPFEIGFFVWTGLGIFIAIFVLRKAEVAWSVIALGLTSPAALWCVECGQMGIFTAGLLVAGLLTAERTPVLAGSMLGMLVMKPQAGCLALVALFARNNLRALGGAAACAALAIVVATLLLGPQAWVQNYIGGREVAKQILQAPMSLHSYETFGVSVFWMARSMGAGVAIAYAMQGVSSLTAAGLTWVVWRQLALRQTERMALIVFFSLLATPYGYTSDMVAYSLALAAMAHARQWRINLLDVFFWLWPALCPIISNATGVLFTPAVVVLAAARAW